MKNAFIVGALAFEASPYDGHTLKDSLNQTKRFLDQDKLGDVYVDDGYKNHGCEDIAEVYLVKRGWRKLPRSIRRWSERNRQTG